MLTAKDAIRLIDKVPMPMGDGCWEWGATRTGRGYGSFRIGESNLAAHRVVYEYLVGPVPDGLVLDHLCRNRPCVRPDHLEPVTQQENVLRGEGRAAENAAKTHCIRGHEFTPENTLIQRSGSTIRGRACKKCMRWLQQRWRGERRAELIESGQKAQV